MQRGLRILIAGIWVAMPIQTAMGLDAKSAFGYYQAGKAAYAKHKYNEALEAYTKALKMNRELGNEEATTTILNNIGETYRSLHQYDKAIDYYNEALEIAKRLGDEARVATRLFNIGFAYNSLYQYDKSIEYYSRALEIDNSVESHLETPGFCL